MWRFTARTTARTLITASAGCLFTVALVACDGKPVNTPTIEPYEPELEQPATPTAPDNALMDDSTPLPAQPDAASTDQPDATQPVDTQDNTTPIGEPSA